MTSTAIDLIPIGPIIETVVDLHSEAAGLPAWANVQQAPDSTIRIAAGHPTDNEQLDPSEWWVINAIVLDPSRQPMRAWAFTMGDGDMSCGTGRFVDLAVEEDSGGRWLVARAAHGEESTAGGQPVFRILLSPAQLAGKDAVA